MVDRRRADAVDEAAARFSATVGEVPEVGLSGKGLLRSSVPFLSSQKFGSFHYLLAGGEEIPPPYLGGCV